MIGSQDMLGPGSFWAELSQSFLFLLRAVCQPFRASSPFSSLENKSSAPCVSPFTSNEICMVMWHFVSDWSSPLKSYHPRSNVTVSPVPSPTPKAKSKQRNQPFFPPSLNKCLPSVFPGLGSVRLSKQPLWGGSRSYVLLLHGPP